MDLRDRRGFSAAEGCMFAAVGLFVLLLVVLLTLAVLRARNPPEPLPPPGRAVGMGGPGDPSAGTRHRSSVIGPRWTVDRAPTTGDQAGRAWGAAHV